MYRIGRICVKLGFGNIFSIVRKKLNRPLFSLRPGFLPSQEKYYLSYFMFYKDLVPQLLQDFLRTAKKLLLIWRFTAKLEIR